MGNVVTIKELELSEIQLARKVNRHSIYLRGYNHKLLQETKVYRYIRLSTLLDMFFFDKMHISNMQDFTDLREKKGLKKIVKELSSIYSFSAVPNNRDRRREEKFKNRTLSVCVSCWTFDRRNNGKTDESFLMWKAYSQGDIICRIGTTIGQLIDSIKETPSNIVISDVDYKGKIELNEYENLIFRKSIYYEDEQEVRMVVLSKNRNGVDLTIDNSILLNEIKLSPFIPPALRTFILEKLIDLCKKRKFYKIKIELSKVMEYVETNKNSKTNKNS